jgi:glycerol uptake facilitator-like aquaporin
MSGLIEGNWHALRNCWVYLIGPLTGGLFGAIYYDYIYVSNYPKKVNDE